MRRRKGITWRVFCRSNMRLVPLSGHSTKRDGIGRRRGRNAYYSVRRRIRAGTARRHAVALERGKGQDVMLVDEQLAKAGLPALTTGLTLMRFPKALVPCPRDLYYRG